MIAVFVLCCDVWWFEQFGNLTKGCVTAGAHYNPHGKTHGNIADTERHVGDMGNITSAGGKAQYDAVSN